METVKEHAVEIKNNDPVVYEKMNVNEIHWQGDVGILRIKEIPESAAKDKKPNSQLAPGTTKGSRHIIADISCIDMYVKSDATPLEGSIIDCKSPTEITHPEHGNVTIPEGIYAIVYQRAYADELRRVAD